MRTNAVALRLDLLAARRRRVPWPAWLALLLSAALVAGLIEWRQDLEERLDTLQGRQDQLHARLRPLERARPAPPPGPQDLRRIELANQVIEELAVPWGALWRSLERAEGRGARLTQLRPDPRERSLRMAGEAGSIDELLAYLDRLAAQPVLSQVHLVSHQAHVATADAAEGGERAEGVEPVAGARPAQASARGLDFTAVATWRQP